MDDSAALHLPSGPLASAVFAAIERDTRGRSLSNQDRFNHFPASPLVALTLVLEGETRLVPNGGGLVEALRAPALPQISLAGPQPHPVTSWNPGPVHILTLGFYPDGWQTLTGQTPAEISADQTGPLPSQIADLAQAAITSHDPWATLSGALASLCQPIGPQTMPARLSGWAKSAITRAALSTPGQSLRSLERRLKRQSGQSRQTLDFFARVEDLHRVARQNPDAPLAGIATDAGFADQSHMGRTLRRATGYSPARLNRHIAEDEAFWAYRLLGERF